MILRISIFCLLGFSLAKPSSLRSGESPILSGSEASKAELASPIAPGLRYESIDQAIARGDLEDVQRHLVADPGCLQQGKSSEFTPLVQSIMRKKVGIINFLVSQGANPDKADSSGKTPLHWSVERNLPEVTRALLGANADPERLDRIGWTPLHHAGAGNKLEVARALLHWGANPNALSERGGTPLHEAAASGGLELINLLLNFGSDPSVVSKEGVKALDVAKKFQNQDAIEVLEPLSKVQPKDE